jgi:hypothetical protein
MCASIAMDRPVLVDWSVLLQQQTNFYELSVDTNSQLKHRSTRQQTRIKEHRVPDIASQTSRAAAGGKRRRARILYSLMWVCGRVELNSVSVVTWHRLKVHRWSSAAVNGKLSCPWSGLPCLQGRFHPGHQTQHILIVFTVLIVTYVSSETNTSWFNFKIEFLL